MGVLIVFHQTFKNKTLDYTEYFEKTQWLRDRAHDSGSRGRMFESRRVEDSTFLKAARILV